MSDNGGTHKMTPAEIEREIEHTREQMGRDIDAISDRLDPRRLKIQARDSVVDAKEVVVDKVRDAANTVGEQARHAGDSVLDAVKRHPVPAAVVGGGIAWLLMRSRDSASRPEYPGTAMAEDYRYTGEEEEPGRLAAMRENMSEKREQLAGRAQNLKGRARERARQAGSRVQGLFEENPLLVGAGILVLGAAIGSLLPETERENRAFGETRDRLMDRAKETAGEVKDVARETLRSAKDTAQEELRERGSEVGASVREAATHVAEEAKQTARREAEQRDLTTGRPGAAPL